MKLALAFQSLAPVQAPEATHEDIHSEFAEFAAIRQELMLEQEEYAKLLKITLPILTGYLYARVQRIPQNIIDRARLLRATFNQSEREMRVYLSGTPMSVLVKQWSDILKIEDERDLACVFKVSKLTIVRWKKDVKPKSIRSLLLYQHRVDALAAIQNS